MKSTVRRRAGGRRSPIYLHLPFGNTFGWGIFGVAVARELARLGATRAIADDLTADTVGDALAYEELVPLLFSTRDLAPFLTREGVIRLDGPLLQTIADKTLVPDLSGLKGTRTVGYTFFEENLLAPEWIENARRCFDAVVTGSTWCTRILEEHGLETAVTAIQGVDTRHFHPLPAREPSTDRFVVYSGGKFEFRKGQDIVIRAYKVLQDRHRDVSLVNTWHNPWDWSFDTMRRSPLIRFRRSRHAGVDAIQRILSDNGIDVSRVTTLGPLPHQRAAEVYHATDVGLFPSRAEGGFNLVLAEYMACGKPAIATATTGQSDIVSERTARVIEAGREVVHEDERGIAVASWPEPDLDSAVEELEWAYQNRERLARIGARAGRTMRCHTWRRTARTLRQVLLA